MATTSQKMMLGGYRNGYGGKVQGEDTIEATHRAPTHLIKFLVLIRGVRTPPPMMEDPVKKMPLQERRWISKHAGAK